MTPWTYRKQYVQSNQTESKYKAVKQTFNGRSYHSRLEATYAANLEHKRKAGIISKITPQFKIDLRVNGVHIANYFIDFRVDYPDGSIELIEVKGFETDLWKLKWKLTQALIEDILPGAKLILAK